MHGTFHGQLYSELETRDNKRCRKAHSTYANDWQTSGCYSPGMGQTEAVAVIRLVSFTTAPLMRREREMLVPSSRVVAVQLSTAAAAAVAY